MRWESVKYAEMSYHKSFEVRMGGRTHLFDSFECAIHALRSPLRHFPVIASLDHITPKGRHAGRWLYHPKRRSWQNRLSESLLSLGDLTSGRYFAFEPWAHDCVEDPTTGGMEGKLADSV